MKKIFRFIILQVVCCLGVYNFFIKKELNQKYIKTDSSNTTWESFTGVDIKYHDAYENCVSLLQNPGYFLSTYIDTSKISVEVVTDLDKEKVQLFDMDTGKKDNFPEPDKEYWCFTAGRQFFCTKLLCNPETDEVIGYMKDESCILPEKYCMVYENCIFMVKKFNNEAPYIKKDRVSIDLLQDTEKEKVKIFKNDKREHLLEPDKEYWCFTVGGPEYCVKLVCNLETNEVIGYIDDKIYYNIFSG